MSLADALRRRRSIRGLQGPPLSREEIEGLVELALLAPAPHHTRPWRFASISQARRAALASAMAAAWEADMIADGLEEAVRRRALERSRGRIEGAPTLLLGCLVGEGLNTYPDEERTRAEWTMAAHSFGAALQTCCSRPASAGSAPTGWPRRSTHRTRCGGCSNCRRTGGRRRSSPSAAVARTTVRSIDRRPISAAA